jgi:hypothetical protein
MAAAKQTQTTPAAKVLTNVDRSVKTLTTLKDTLDKTNQECQNTLATFADQVAGLVTDIEVKTSELQAVTASLETAQRESSAELRLRVKEDRESVLAELLKEAGLVGKTPAEITSLETQLADALEDNQDAIEAAVKAKEDEVKSIAASKLLEITSAHKVAIAELNAKAQNDAQTIAFLKEQNGKLEAQIEADRNARVEIAKAEKAQPTQINMATAK